MGRFEPVVVYTKFFLQYSLLEGLEDSFECVITFESRVSTVVDNIANEFMDRRFRGGTICT